MFIWRERGEKRIHEEYFNKSLLILALKKKGVESINLNWQLTRRNEIIGTFIATDKHVNRPLSYGFLT